MIRSVKDGLLHWVLAPIACTLIVAGLLAGGWALGLQISGNVHVVDPGILYRSAQLNGEELADVLTKYNIQTVINLRGENLGEWWYEDELSIAAAHEAAHFDVGMGATSEPESKVVAQLLTIMKTAPRPILIHCYSGADRTGLAAALYERFLKKQSAQTASGQLSFLYGHFPWLGSRTVAMDNAFWRLASRKQNGIIR